MRGFSSLALVVVVSGVICVASPVAKADQMTVSPEAGDPIFRPVTHERRAGVVLGFAPGLGFAGSSGYPNNPSLINRPEYYSASPLLVGSEASYFLMGALTDYLSFGPMLNLAHFANSQWESTGFGIGFRLEVFPLIYLAPTFADTAVYTQLGIGHTDLAAKGPYPDADGTASFLAIGVHHEFRLVRFLGGHFTAGPFVDYNVITSLSAERHWLSLGVRVAWYGGTVKADAR
jgi:hypothetical protein